MYLTGVAHTDPTLPWCPVYWPANIRIPRYIIIIFTYGRALKFPEALISIGDD